MGSVEIITSVQRRRRWSPGEKKAIVEEAEQPGTSVAVMFMCQGFHSCREFLILVLYRLILTRGSIKLYQSTGPSHAQPKAGDDILSRLSLPFGR